MKRPLWKRLLVDWLSKEQKRRLRSVLHGLDAWRYRGEPDHALAALERLHLVFGRRCNQHCVMCRTCNDGPDMPARVWQQGLAAVLPTVKTVIMQGGEPTILPSVLDFWEAIVAVNEVVRFEMMTNGRAFDRQWQERFLQRGRTVNFSLNAATEATYATVTQRGSFSEAVANLKATIKARDEWHAPLVVTASMVIIDENLHELTRFIDFCQQLGVDKVRLFHDAVALPRQEDLLQRELATAQALCQSNPTFPVEGLVGFTNQMAKADVVNAGCMCPMHSLYVDERGDAYFCCHLSLPIGNLLESDVNALWNGFRAKKQRACIIRGDRRWCGRYCRPISSGERT